jgi:hypothetical protein
MAATIVVGGSIAATSVKSAFAASNNNSGNTVTAQINSQSATQSGFDNHKNKKHKTRYVHIQPAVHHV